MEDYLEIENWLKMMQEELSMILRELGYDSIDALSRQNLRALDFETASVSGLRLSDMKGHCRTGLQGRC